MRKRKSRRQPELAQIVDANPAPILQFSLMRGLLYANAASAPVLIHYDVVVGQPVPSAWSEFTRQVGGPGIAHRAVMRDCGLVIELLIVRAGENADLFNIFGRDITRETELERELLEETRLKTMQAMAVTYAHEISNPLAIALGYLQQGLGRLTEDKMSRVLDALNRIAETMKRIREVESRGAEFTSYEGDSQMIKVGPKKKD